MSDEMIMDRVRQGQLEETSLLYERYYPQLYNFYLRISFNREVSKDLTQNVFMRLLKYRHTYDPGNNFRSWIFRIARNEFSDHLKKAAREGLNYHDLEEINLELGNHIEDNEKLDEMRILQKAMCMIDTEYRSLIVMSRYHKLKYREIAEITGSNENAVKAKLFRAMNKLRDAFFSIQNI